MPCLWTTLLDRVGVIIVVSFVAGSYASNADESDKKLTNSAPYATTTISPKPTSTPSPSRIAGKVQPLATDLQRQGAPTFIENRGQFPEQVKFQRASGGRTVWLTNGGVVLDLPNDHPPAHESGSPARPPTHYPPQRAEQRDIQRLAVYEEFIGANPSPEIVAKTPRPGIYNYFIGSDPSKWRTDVKGYAEVVYRDVWDGIDVRFFGNGPNLEQEFVVAPGADLSQVRIAYKGIDALDVNADGSLRIRTTFGELRESPPKVYQEITGEQVPVQARFRLTDEKAYTFAVDHYRAEYALVIDPTLLYSTYLGGSAGIPLGNPGEYANGIAVDSTGNAYVTGFTSSPDFPTTPGSYQQNSTTLNSAFVTKLSPLGNQLVYSAFLSGMAASTTGEAIAFDSSGDAYVTGSSGTGFPTTANAFQAACGTPYGPSAFLTVLNATGNQLVYSTCLGDASIGNGIAVDASGLAYLTGNVLSVHLPTTPSAEQSTPGGGQDGFVTILNPAASGASSLVYSTYLGGSDSDYGHAIAVDSFGNIYVTGTTTGSHFPVTPGAYQTISNAGCQETGGCITAAFVAKLNPNVSGASGLIYATYLSGSFGSTSAGIAVDGSGNAYVAGSTTPVYVSPVPAFIPFPTTPGAFLACTDSGGLDSYAFVSKLNASGNGLVYSTCLGGGPSVGTPIQSASGVALDSNEDAYVTGSTRSSIFTIDYGCLSEHVVRGRVRGRRLYNKAQSHWLRANLFFVSWRPRRRHFPRRDRC